MMRFCSILSRVGFILVFLEFLSGCIYISATALVNDENVLTI